jgi:hypothetical protein
LSYLLALARLQERDQHEDGDEHSVGGVPLQKK